jgi:hypothetical protein
MSVPSVETISKEAKLKPVKHVHMRENASW